MNNMDIEDTEVQRKQNFSVPCDLRSSVRSVSFSENNHPVEERSGSNAVTKRYFSQGEQAVGVKSPNDKLFYLKDHLGSVRGLINNNFTSQTVYDYDPYGRRTKVSGTLDTVVGYTGHHWHEKSGLYLTWYRQYDPNLGRWLSRDPLKDAEILQGPNLYAYVGNNPIERIDPDGRIAWIPVMVAIGVGYGAIKLIEGGAKACISAKSLLDQQDAFREAYERVQNRYGDNIPWEIQQMLNNWRSDYYNNTGQDIGNIISGIPGTSFTGPATNPPASQCPPPSRPVPSKTPTFSPPWYGREP